MSKTVVKNIELYVGVEVGFYNKGRLVDSIIGHNIEEIKTDMLTTISIKEKIDSYEIRNIYFIDNIESKYEGVRWDKYILISKFVFKNVSYGKIRAEYCSSTMNRNIFNIMNEIDAMDKKEFDWIFINNEDNGME